MPQLPGSSKSEGAPTCKGRGDAGLKEVGLASGDKKKKSKRRRAALRHLLRLPRCGRLKPGKMVATYFLSQVVTAVAGLLLLSFGSLATSQIEVGVRASEREGPGRTALLWP